MVVVVHTKLWWQWVHDNRHLMILVLMSTVLWIRLYPQDYGRGDGHMIMLVVMATELCCGDNQSFLPSVMAKVFWRRSSIQDDGGIDGQRSTERSYYVYGVDNGWCRWRYEKGGDCGLTVLLSQFSFHFCSIEGTGGCGKT